MNWKERIRVLSDRLFDLAGLESPGRNQAPYKLDNEIKRVLAHLAATDGTHTRLLRALESGVLRTSSEGSELRTFRQGSDGTLVTDVDMLGGLPIEVLSEGVLVISPFWFRIMPPVQVRMVEGTSDEYDFIMAREIGVQVNVGYGGTDESIEIGWRESSGAQNYPILELPKGGEARFCTNGQFLYIKSTTGDAVVYLRGW